MMDNVFHHYRQLAGVLLKDWRRYARALAAPGMPSRLLSPHSFRVAGVFSCST